MAYAWMLNFWFAPPLQSQVSIRTPEAVLEFGSSRQRPDLAFLKKNAPVWASAVIVQSWLGAPALQSLMASCVPFPTELPNPARSTHLALLAVMVDFTAIALGWPAFAQRFEMRHDFALFRQLQAQLPASLCLPVERLRHRRGAAHLTESQHLQPKVAGVILHLHEVAGPDLARRLGCYSVGLNPAKFTCPCSQRARLEESGGPKPLVHSHADHDPILLPAPLGVAGRARARRRKGC